MTTILAIMPHPDDAEFFAGGTLALRTDQGDRVILAIATDGGLGSFSIPAQELAAQRMGEADRAASVLGIGLVEWLGHPDGGLDSLPPGQLRLEIVRCIRSHRPDGVVSLDPQDASEAHPDHRALARAVVEALLFSHLPLFDPGSGSQHIPHWVAEKYFAATSSHGANRFVDIGLTLERKLQALLEHRSQVDFLVEDVVRQAARAGVDLSSLLGTAAASPHQLLAAAVRLQAAQVGAAAGIAFAEAFRYARFHPFVEQLLPDEGGA